MDGELADPPPEEAEAAKDNGWLLYCSLRTGSSNSRMTSRICDEYSCWIHASVVGLGTLTVSSPFSNEAKAVPEIQFW